MKYTESDFRELLRQFEGMVRALNTKFNEDEIFKLVALILNNHIQDGIFTPEYINYSRAALNNRKLEGQKLSPIAAALAGSDFSPRPKKL